MDSRTRPLAAAVAALLGLAIATGTAHAGISASDALTIANQWRAQAHLPAIASMDSAENTGCDHHNNYMAQNGNQLNHYETSGNPGYTSDGATAGAQSVLAQSESTPLIWDGSVYHRVRLLEPRLYKSGFAATHGFTCMQVLGDNIGTTSTSTLQLYPWPPNGGTGVPLTFDAHESPNPYDLTPGVKQLGYLLSVNANGPWYSIYSTHMRISYASLVTDGGTPVQVTVADDNTPSIAPYLDADFALFPHGALKPATTYTARAVGKAENSSNSLSLPFDLTWHFTTAGKVTPAPKANRLKLSKGKVAGKKVNFTLTASPVLVGHTAKLTKTIKRKGKPATVTSSSFKLKSSQTISVAPAPKGGSVKLTVSTGSFVREGLRYPAATASRTLSG